MRNGDGRRPCARVIALGSSRGGLNALRTILAELPEAFPAPLLIAQHRSADGATRLVELLQLHSRLRVVEPDDKDPIAPGHAYVAPADYHMLAEPGWIALSTEPPISFARPSIDALFESVAHSYGSGAVAVVLTSSNHDGVDGALAVRDAGGSVLVEDPASAESPVLPSAVIARLTPNAVVPLSDIAGTLVDWCEPESAELQIPRRT